MEKRMIQGQVVSVYKPKKIPTKNGLRPICDMKVQTIANESLTVTLWLEDDGIMPIQTGQNIMVPVRISHKTQKGKNYTNYSGNLKDVECVTPIPDAPDHSPVVNQSTIEIPKPVEMPSGDSKPTQEYWDNRNESIVRQHSQEMGLRMVNILALTHNQELSALSQDQVFQLVQKYTMFFDEDVTSKGFNDSIPVEDEVTTSNPDDTIPF